MKMAYTQPVLEEYGHAHAVTGVTGLVGGADVILLFGDNGQDGTPDGDEGTASDPGIIVSNKNDFDSQDQCWLDTDGSGTFNNLKDTPIACP